MQTVDRSDDASREASEIEIVHIESDAQCQEWDAFVRAHPQGTIWQFHWYLKCNERRFATVRTIAVRESGSIVAGAACFRFGLPWPLPGVLVITNAPLVALGHAGALTHLLSALEQDARETRCILLQMESFDASLTDALMDHFKLWPVRTTPVWKLYHPGLWRELRIRLAGHTEQSLLKSFSRLVSRQLRKAEESGVQVVEARDDDAIRTAHDIWVESAQRKDYITRTYADFSNLLKESFRRDLGNLLIAHIGSEPISFLFSILYESGAVAITTGYREKHAEIPSGRLLHWRVMQLALQRGIPYLSLAAPGRGGVRQFKDHFHPELVDNTRFVSVEMSPTCVSLLRPFIRNDAWVGYVRRLGRRLR